MEGEIPLLGIQSIDMSFPPENPLSNFFDFPLESYAITIWMTSNENLLTGELRDEEYNLSRGTNSIEFDDSNLSNGIYIYSLSSETGIISKKMVIGQ